MILRHATTNENHWKREGTTSVVPLKFGHLRREGTTSVVPYECNSKTGFSP